MTRKRRKRCDGTEIILDGVADKLRAIAPVYIDRGSGQGMEAPCFIITPEGYLAKRLPMGRWMREYRLCVTYRAVPKLAVIDPFPMRKHNPSPASADANGCSDTLREMGERLICELELIDTADGGARGVDMRYEVKDGACRFFVTYPVILEETNKLPKMGSLQYAISSDMTCIRR